MKRITVAALFALIVADPGFGQGSWQRTYGGPLGDIGNSVQQTTDGGYVVAGGTDSYGAGGSDFYLIKTDRFGETLWTKTHGGIRFDVGNSVCRTRDHGYAVAGQTCSFGNLPGDAYLVRTDSNGDTLWTRTWGRSGSSSGANAVIETPDDGFVMAGWISTAGFLIRVNSVGDTLWTRTYGGEIMALSSVVQTSDGGYVMAGSTTNFGTICLLKTDSLGDSLSFHKYHPLGYDRCEGRSTRETRDGGYILAGSAAIAANDADVYLIRTDSSGDTIWTRTCGGVTYEYGYSALQTLDDGCIAAGQTYSSGAGGADVYLVRTNPSGDTLWTRTFGGTDNECGYSIQLTQDSGFVVAGVTYSFGAGSNDVYLIKTESLGQVAVQEQTPLTAIPPAGLSLSAGPNPFKLHTFLTCRLPAGNRTFGLSILDVSGRAVCTLLNATEGRRSDQRTFFWDGRNDRTEPVPNGVYLCRLEADNRAAYTKVVLTR